MSQSENIPMPPRDSVVIIPTYKERENVAAIIDAVMRLPQPFDVLIIDDNSPDGTADIVRGKQEEYAGRIHLIERPGKLGLGTAYITGFKWALTAGYEYICEMDADFSHNPDDLVKLRHACAADGADLAVGSRYITGVNVVNWPMGRVLMSYYASAYVRIVTGMPVRDNYRRFRMLPASCARGASARRSAIQRLRIPDRDEIHCLQVRVQDRRGSDNIRKPRTRREQNELRHIRRGCARGNTVETEQSYQVIS